MPIHSHAFAALADTPEAYGVMFEAATALAWTVAAAATTPTERSTLHQSGIPPSDHHPGRHIMSTSTTTARTDKAGTRLTLPVAALAFVIALAVQLIGQAKIDLGIGSIVIFPMVWGLILGLLVSVQKFKPLGLDLQRVAAALVGVAVLLLVARLAFNIGPSLPSLIKAGPALLLQEVGHLLGTIVLALPLAVLLRMGKATVGRHVLPGPRTVLRHGLRKVRPRFGPVPRRPGHVRLRNPLRRRVHHAADLARGQLEDLRPPGPGHGRRRGVRLHDGGLLGQHHRAPTPATRKPSSAWRPSPT